MKGRLPWAVAERDGYRGLAAAIILAALHDAKRGDREAWSWLALDGAELADWIGLDGDVIRGRSV